MISLLIASDIHASPIPLGKDDAPSWYCTLPEFDLPTRNPFDRLPALIQEERLTVDWLISPGDIADRANSQAQESAWRSLVTLKEAVGAKRLIGTVGNHDIDSRLKSSGFDPKTSLQSLKPPFPGLEETGCDFFWARNFFIFEEREIRSIVLNSSAFHGIHSGEKTDDHHEYLHGRVSDRTIDSIVERIVAAEKRKLNILILHHHIYKNEHISGNDYSEMKGGQKLLRLLVDANKGPWLVIHGHQHYPDLFYGSGLAQSPVILSAGSMSGRLSGALAQRALNQVYHVELPIDDYDAIGWRPCGYVRSWHWVDQVGWKRTNFSVDPASIPYGSGFGCRRDPDEWAKEIASTLDAS